MKSVLNRPSQQLRRELALRERFWGFSGQSRSTGPPQKPQESCHRAGGTDGRREMITLKLAEEARSDANGLWAGALENGVYRLPRHGYASVSLKYPRPLPGRLQDLA
jgi:hypothetical protein